jgi:hypothetical protein
MEKKQFHYIKHDINITTGVAVTGLRTCT